MNNCIIAGCDKPQKKNGKPGTFRPHCSMHAARIARHGDAEARYSGPGWRDTRILKTRKGEEIIVCVCHYDLVRKVRWRVNGRGYVSREVGGRKLVLIHRLIMGDPPSSIDHIDGNKLNNRCSNLRPATDSQNMANRPTPKTNTTGYKGVSRSGKKYRATISVSGRSIHLGSFHTPLAAAVAYNFAAVQYFGEYARLNRLDSNGS